MGDFLLDLRPRRQRVCDLEPLRFFADMEVDVVATDRFSWLATRVAPAEVASPFVADDGLRVAVCGNPLVEPRHGKSGAGAGGSTARSLHDAYRESGLDGVAPVNGGAVVMIYDPRGRQTHLVTDLCGVGPCFIWEDAVVSSHPDFLARATGVGQDWDTTSLAELLLTGRVSPPHSYYRGVRAVGANRVLTWSDGERVSERRLSPAPDTPAFDGATEEDLAGELAAALEHAVERRTHARLGRTAVALSGGLDSRAILCSTPRGRVFAVSTFDRENAEFRVAQRIARACDVELVPLPRDFEHYGNAAELAVRISGGMGDFGSAHFLGFRAQLRDLGIDNLVTGCYFDYLFKALALDVSTSRWLRRERLGPFRVESYLPHFNSPTPLARKVRERLEDGSQALRSDLSSAGRFRLAAARTFPLAAEGDNLQRIVTQKMVGWHAPAVDPEVVAVYRRVPPGMRLNRSLFKRVVRRTCGARLRWVPDANTGLPVAAPPWLEGIHRYRVALRRRRERGSRSIVTQESWPNWVYYLNQSRVVRAIWERPNSVATDLFREILGTPPARLQVRSDRDCRFALRLVTLKIWLDQRCGMGDLDGCDS
jgi:asparagine synthase (glutamine-hydrolysing)